MIYIQIFVSLLGGFFVGWIVRQKVAAHLTQSAETKARDIISKAKIKQQEVFLKAKEEASKIIDRAKQEEDLRRRELKIMEERIEKRNPPIITPRPNCFNILFALFDYYFASTSSNDSINNNCMIVWLSPACSRY